MLTLQQIIDEVDITVDNEYSVGDKVSWLNHINQDFFNVVKIPKIETFVTTDDEDYILNSDIRAKNIDLVHVGNLVYFPITEGLTRPTQNQFVFDDDTNNLSLHPKPYKEDLKAIVRYHKIATTTFLSSNLEVSPDAPSEYHWTYIPALCEKISLAMDDGIKAANFANQYRSAWNVAAQNYRGDAG